MKRTDGSRGPLTRRLLAAAGTAALLSALAPAPAHSFNKGRMEKDIAIMENVINTAMVESELVYVFDTNTNVRGLYVPEFGALFTLQAQLTSDWASPYFSSWRYYGGKGAGGAFWPFSEMDKDKLEKLLKKLDITVNGKKVNLDEYLEHIDEGDKALREKDESPQEREKIEKKKLKRKRELVRKNLEEYKEELAGIIADYGGTIRQLDDDQWIMIVAYLGSPHKAMGVSKLIVKAKKGDVDLYDRGDIDYDKLRSRMVVEQE